MPSLSTHVLDATGGGPLGGVVVTVTTVGGSPVASDTTGDDGRIGLLAADLPTGRYRLTWTLPGAGRIFPTVAADAELREERHYHVPVLSSPASAVVYLGA